MAPHSQYALFGRDHRLMKFVLPVHHFPPRYSAGAELYTLQLARRLRAQGHHVEVICIEAIDRENDGTLHVEEDNYEGFTVWRLFFDLIHAPDPQAWRYANPLLGRWFTDYFRQHRPDIAHFQAGYLLGAAPLEAAADNGIPTVLTLHDYWFLCPRITLLRGDGTLCEAIPSDPAGCAWCLRLESRRYRIPDRLTQGVFGSLIGRLAMDTGRSAIAHRRARLLAALTIPAAVIAPSRFLAERFAPFIEPKRLRVLRFGLDREPFIRQHRAADDGVLRIGFTGQIAPHKGVHLLIEAFRRVQARQPIELHIYGGLEAHPDYVRRLRRLADNDGRIQFHGRFENGRVAEILTALDVNVAPSIWYENSPIAILESQAAGTPVIAAALGGMAELVQHGVNGLLFRVNDAHDLAQQIARLLDEPGLLDSLRANTPTVKTPDEEMAELFELYRQIARPA